MKNKVLIIKNITHEQPGLMIEILDKYDIKYDIFDLSKKLEFPKIEHYNLIIIMGGPDSANDETDKILNELEFVKRAFKNNIPMFGVCLGLQLIVKAYGGEVYMNSVEECGFKQDDNKWYTIKLNKEGLKDPIFENINNNFIVFQLHSETIKLIKGIKLLGTGDSCLNQIIKIGNNIYGFQFHFELTEELLRIWFEKAPELKEKNKKQILSDFNNIKDSYLKRGKQLFENYIKLIRNIK